MRLGMPDCGGPWVHGKECDLTRVLDKVFRLHVGRHPGD